MTIPYKSHRFSVEDCEFILATRKFYPQIKHVVVVAAVLGILTFAGGWEAGLEAWLSAAVALGVALGSMGAIPLLFHWNTGQLAVENYLLGNITSVMGHVNWPPIWQNVLAERAVTFDWADISQAVLRPAPWAFALDNLNLELNFRDGRQRILRVPKLAPVEVEELVRILELIALRRGFRFEQGPPLHPPLQTN
ncbi:MULTISPECIES: hypothetical protein [Devosia]|uniref:hypothetical protein n=1 Tax=Devosia TaxID=46913 RepID=UPI000CE9957E|nr:MULTISPECIES: hypothetical protein [Devosia]AVF02798.1 hypothetical protein C4375_02975 [Devosia sp. I507]AVF05554.1 hypothetical protein C4375_18885 [Devosia sp. I507]